MEVKLGSVPPGGPHYEVASGIMLRAHTFDILYGQIAEYRLRHGIPPGNPKEDVDNYICSRWPHACQSVGNDMKRANPTNASFQSRVSTWAAVKMRDQPIGGYLLVDQHIADSRAKSCLNCPYNKPWSTCSSCSRSALAVLISLRRLRKTSLDNSILGCELCGFDNTTAVHFKIEDLKVNDNTRNSLPQCCWIKKET